MALVWLCATPCGATGPASGPAAATAAATGPAAEVVPARADAAVDVLLPALRRGAVALVLATTVVAGLSAGDARATVGTSDLPAAASAPVRGVPVAVSTPAPAGGGERLFPEGRLRA